MSTGLVSGSRGANQAEAEAPSPRVVVAIAAFRSDPQVIELVRRITTEDWPIESLVVVDSMGSGMIEQYLADHGLGDRVHYHNSPTNLGSAGNLRKRLQLATDRGADFVLALNHDAVVDRACVEALLRYTHLDRIGVLYPLRFMQGKAMYDLTGTSDFAFRANGTPTVPPVDLVEVQWSSSNGALYATAPLVDLGLGPDPSFWMGWEDYRYGLELQANGYRQFIVTEAQTVDEYEYKTVRLARHAIAVAAKPNWYLYYSTRNMILTNLHDTSSPRRTLKTALWVTLMGAHVWMQQDRKDLKFAASAYLRGIYDGLRNHRGKWLYP